MLKGFLILALVALFAAIAAALIVAWAFPERKQKVVRIVRAIEPTDEDVERALLMYGPLTLSGLQRVLINQGFRASQLPALRATVVRLITQRQSVVTDMSGGSILFHSIAIAGQDMILPEECDIVVSAGNMP